MEKYPRSKMMHRRDGKPKVFDFLTFKDYENLCKEGWVENPADLKKKPIKIEPVNEDVQEQKAEEAPEPLIYRPSVPGVPDIEPIDPLQCKLCDFKGKSEFSLKTHKRLKHKD